MSNETIHSATASFVVSTLKGWPQIEVTKFLEYFDVESVKSLLMSDVENIENYIDDVNEQISYYEDCDNYNKYGDR